MPEFGSPFSGLPNDRKLTDEELVRAIRFMVAAEYEAIQLYMQLAESTNNNLAVEVLKDIADEERVHAGEFLRLLSVLAPDEEKLYSEGAEEVEVIIKKYCVKIKSVRHITHDVLQIDVEKPEKFHFIPGQAAEISINKEGWQNQKRPFTFTSLPHEDHLQFIIKTYPSHKGVTNELLQLKKNDEFILNSELKKILGDNFINILSDEDVKGYSHGTITEKFLKGNITDFDKNIYLCGPPPMMDAMEKFLSNLHVDEKLIIKEAF